MPYRCVECGSVQDVSIDGCGSWPDVNEPEACGGRLELVEETAPVLPEVFGVAPAVHFRGEGWTPASHSSGDGGRMVSGGAGPIRTDGESRPHDVGGSDAVDVHGDSVWRPTDGVMRRTLRRMGAPADVGSVERAQDQVRKTERDGNEAHAILQARKKGKSESAAKQLREEL